jgi:hypothetical protein
MSRHFNMNVWILSLVFSISTRNRRGVWLRDRRMHDSAEESARKLQQKRLAQRKRQFQSLSFKPRINSARGKRSEASAGTVDNAPQSEQQPEQRCSGCDVAPSQPVVWPPQPEPEPEPECEPECEPELELQPEPGLEAGPQTEPEPETDDPEPAVVASAVDLYPIAQKVEDSSQRLLEALVFVPKKTR